MVILLNYTAILCIVHGTRMFIYIGYWTLNIYIIIIIISVMFLKHENNFRDMNRLVLYTCIFNAIHCYRYTVVIRKQQSILNSTRMSQFINNPIHSMDLCNVLLHCTTIKYYIILSYRIYYHLPDIYIYTACAPLKYILLFKCVWILINVRKIVFFCIFICVHISLFYSLVYIFISVCLGVSLCQSDIEVRHAHYTISRANRTHGKSALHSNNFQYSSVTRNIKCTRRTAITF